ncbi:hypothetical protein LINPERHAP1_LOCUS9232 [Linum perenne]
MEESVADIIVGNCNFKQLLFSHLSRLLEALIFVADKFF